MRGRGRRFIQHTRDNRPMTDEYRPYCWLGDEQDAHVLEAEI